MITEQFAGLGWEVPRLLAAMPAASDFYFDTASQVHLDHWSDRRVALIGDAAHAAGPGGNGTGNAVVAAAVLAGELAASPGDHQAALARYEQRLRPYVTRAQKQAADSQAFLAPATWQKIRLAQPVLQGTALPARHRVHQTLRHQDRRSHHPPRLRPRPVLTRPPQTRPPQTRPPPHRPQSRQPNP